jgi:pimeloyl-ACP methyl ester carboxylesterase
MARQDKYVTIDGLKIRYIDEGNGIPVFLTHGASLGSSSDVFARNLPPLAAGGLRAIAFDQAGFGLSDVPADHSDSYRCDTILKFADALLLDKVALIAHSMSGTTALQVALSAPERITHLMAVSTGQLLPPLEGPAPEGGARGGDGDDGEPTPEASRKALAATLYHTDLITGEEMKIRHTMSVGKNYQAHVARNAAGGGPGGSRGDRVPLWKRVTELQMPYLYMVGRNDRGQAGERAEQLKKMMPALDIRIVEHCKHLLLWDAAKEFEAAVVAFVTSTPQRRVMSA